MRNARSPVWRVPSHSPGPRNFRSSSAITKPSLVSRITARRFLAVNDNGVW